MDKNLTPTEELVLRLIKQGNANHPITRKELCEATGLKDSFVREIVGKLRDKGCRVVGSATTKGYYIARSEKQYKAFREEYYNKAMTYLKRISAMDGATEGQVAM